jgi:hypothetical protein
MGLPVSTKIIYNNPVHTGYQPPNLATDTFKITHTYLKEMYELL